MNPLTSPSLLKPFFVTAFRGESLALQKSFHSVKLEVKHDSQLPIARLEYASKSFLQAQVGIGSERSRRNCEKIVSYFAPELVAVVGFCGALTDDLKCGDVLVAEEVLSTDPKKMRYVLNKDLKELLTMKSTSSRVVFGSLLTSEKIIGETQHRTEWAKSTGAVGVDMESYAVGEICHQHDIPFLAVKVVLDETHIQIPENPKPEDFKKLAPHFIQASQALSDFWSWFLNRHAANIK